MKEEEFLKEHPSLKVFRLTTPIFWGKPHYLVILKTHVEETQLDKQKVKEVIDEAIRVETEDHLFVPLSNLKKELGL